MLTDCCGNDPKSTERCETSHASILSAIAAKAVSIDHQRRHVWRPFVLGGLAATVLGTLLGSIDCGGGPSGSAGTGGSMGTGSGGITGSGGVRATGGATGGGDNAGSGGSGGSKATGGMTGTGGTGAAACTGCKVTITSECQAGADTKTIHITVDVLDGSLAALPLAAVSFRYWFVLGETTAPPQLSIDYAQMFQNGTGITSKFVGVSPAVTGANEYLEIGFAAGAPTLTGFADTGQIQLRFFGANNADSFDLDQTMDYSYRACGADASAGFINAPNITGYIDGVLAWGTEPE